MGYREQKTYAFEASFNGDTILADYSPEHGLTGEPHLLVRVEENGASWYEGDPEPWGDEIRMPEHFAQAFHRFLGGHVLPKVERQVKDEETDLVFYLVEGVVYAKRHKQVIWTDALSRGHEVVRSQIACLQVAADDAEGVSDAQG